MDQSAPTKLVVAVVQIEDVHDLTERLVADNFGATRIDAAGGFLRRENAVVLVATTDERLPTLLEAIRWTCRRRTTVWFPPMTDGMVALPGEAIEVEVGGAVVFVLPIERAVYLSELPASAGAHPAGRHPAKEVEREAAALGA